MKLFIYTSLALLAFAANSLLCRMALSGQEIEPIPFTMIRLFSGAVLLAFLVRPNVKEVGRWRHNFLPAMSLALYAFAFSWAYIAMDTGMGALILFATIQIVLNLIAQIMGEKTNVQIIAGITIAFSGLVTLLLPGQSAADIDSALIMMLAGLGWAGFVYSGRGSTEPLRDVAIAFRWSLVVCIPFIFGVDWRLASVEGILLAVLSGTLASGLGYALWYKVLPELGLQNAAQVQLSVPVLAMMMGVGVLGETISVIMMFASLCILVGIVIAIKGKRA